MGRAIVFEKRICAIWQAERNYRKAFGNRVPIQWEDSLALLPQQLLFEERRKMFWRVGQLLLCLC